MAFTDGLKLGGAREAWSPVITSQSGSGLVTTLNKAIFYRWSIWCWFSIDFTVTAVGTSGGFINVTLPVAGTSLYSVVAGRESGVDGRMLRGTIPASSNLRIVYASDLATVCQINKRPILSGMYEA